MTVHSFAEGVGFGVAFGGGEELGRVTANCFSPDRADSRITRNVSGGLTRMEDHARERRLLAMYGIEEQAAPSGRS